MIGTGKSLYEDQIRRAQSRRDGGVQAAAGTDRQRSAALATGGMPAAAAANKNQLGGTALRQQQQQTQQQAGTPASVALARMNGASGAGKSPYGQWIDEQAAALREKAPYESQYSGEARALYGEIMGREPYKSPYEEQIKGLYDSLLARPEFSYDVEKDPLYQKYRDQYIRGGQQAMRDTMGQAAALTGGYGSSWGSTAGYQAYQNYLAGLNDRVPELYQSAYNRYTQEGDDLRTRLSTALAMDEKAYGEYQDETDALKAKYNAAYNAEAGDWERYLQEVQNAQNMADFYAALRASNGSYADSQQAYLDALNEITAQNQQAYLEALEAAGLELPLEDYGAGSSFDNREYLASKYGIKSGALKKNESPASTLGGTKQMNQWYQNVYDQMDGKTGSGTAGKTGGGSAATGKSANGGLAVKQTNGKKGTGTIQKADEAKTDIDEMANRWIKN